MICRLSVLIDQWNIQRADRTPSDRLTQTSLAEQSGVSRATISRLYHNNFDRIDNRTIELLCEFFDCQVGDLLVVKDQTDT